MPESVTITSADGGALRAHLATPDIESRTTALPAVVLLHEIFGANKAMRRAAERFAEVGYQVLVPDLFWRIEPGIELSYSPEDRNTALDLLSRFDADLAVADVATTVEHARHLPGSNGNVALVGFCLGGLIAVRAAPEAKPQAVASLYGVRIDQYLDDIQTYGGPVSLHFGADDDLVPIETAKQISEATRDFGNVDVHIYPGAGHGFFNSLRRDLYNEAAAQLAFARIHAQLNSTAALSR